MADFPAAVPALPQLPSYTQDDILALFDRLLPNHYLAPLKDPGPGYEYLQAVAKMIERVSEAISHVGSGCYIGSSTGGSYSTVVVELYRDSDFFGPVTLLGRCCAPQGTLVGTADGYYYQLMNNAIFGENDLGPIAVEAQAVTRGWLWNKPGPFYTADGEFIDGPINRLVKPVFPLTPSPPNFDPTIKVRQKYNTAGVTFTRTAIGDEVILLAGTVVQSTTGVQYVTMDTATFEASSYSTNQVRARPIAPLFSNWGVIDKIISISWGSTARPVGLLVEQFRSWAPSDASGGSSPMLDGVGYDRGLPRNFSGIRSVQLEIPPGDPSARPVVIMPGTVLSTADGYRYQTTGVLSFAVDEFGPKAVSVEPLFLNEPANLGPLTTVVEVKWGSDITTTLQVYDPVAPSRETDDAYRARLTFLPKTLTPNAIKEAITNSIGNILSQLGKTWDIRETWDIRYQSAYDFPTAYSQYLIYANTAVPVAPYPSAVFVYDYAPLEQALSNRYLSGNPERGVMVVRLPNLGPADNAATYPGLAATLEQIKPAGATVLYVFGDQ